VRMRASQPNGCAYCPDLHSKEPPSTATRWPGARRGPAAEQWAPDAVFEEVARRFDEEEIVASTLAIVAINGWNRLAVGLRSPVGHYVSPHRPKHTAADQRRRAALRSDRADSAGGLGSVA
jgi:alkylhydroperoxidase family enzyme